MWLYEPLLLALELFAVVPFSFLVLPWEAPFSGFSLFFSSAPMAGMLIEMTGSARVLIKGDGRQQEAKASDQKVQRVSRVVGAGSQQSEGEPLACVRAAHCPLFPQWCPSPSPGSA